MNNCVFCLKQFEPVKHSVGKFCSQECFRKYEQLDTGRTPLSRLGYGSGGKTRKVKLEDLCDDAMQKDVLESHDRFSCVYNPELNSVTKSRLKNIVLGLKSYRKVNGLN